jgi:hypothetical protein
MNPGSHEYEKGKPITGPRLSVNYADNKKFRRKISPPFKDGDHI